MERPLVGSLGFFLGRFLGKNFPELGFKNQEGIPIGFLGPSKFQGNLVRLIILFPFPVSRRWFVRLQVVTLVLVTEAFGIWASFPVPNCFSRAFFPVIGSPRKIFFPPAGSFPFLSFLFWPVLAGCLGPPVGQACPCGPFVWVAPALFF